MPASRSSLPSGLVLRVLALAANRDFSAVAHLILALAQHNPGCSQAHLMKELHRLHLSIDSAGVSRHLQRFSRLGLIVMQPGPDQRSVSVRITRDAQRLLNDFFAEFTALIQQENLAVPATVFVFPCPSCQRQLRTPSNVLKSRLRCTSCRQEFSLHFAEGRVEIHLNTVAGGSAKPQPNRPPHVVLGVSPSSSPEEISIARRKLISLFHPDKFAHLGADFVSLATAKTQEINVAHDHLTRR